MSIIRYSKKYEEKYHSLYRETWKVEPYGELFSDSEITESVDKNKSFLYLLINDNSDSVIGFVGGRAISDCSFFDNKPKLDLQTVFYIDELGIEKEHKRLGWGATLTQFLINTARESGFSQFILRTHASHINPAISLYYKLGFKTMKTDTGDIYGIDTQQTRIDGRADTDFRIYFYKQYS